ncbi:hypothetical protein L7F22_000178, partial [Adiantum nelumboides]|nr:hypothetical protein [Adiantum nelumboides]
MALNSTRSKHLSPSMQLNVRALLRALPIQPAIVIPPTIDQEEAVALLQEAVLCMEL